LLRRANLTSRSQRNSNHYCFLAGIAIIKAITATIEHATAVVIVAIVIANSHCLDSKPLIPYFCSQFSNCVFSLIVLAKTTTLGLLVSPKAIITARILYSAIDFCCEALRTLRTVASIRSTHQLVAFLSRTRYY